MATILEGAMWVLDENVADHMVETGLLVKCERKHNMAGYGLPVYHIAWDAPPWFGMHSLPVAIAGAERALENTAINKGEEKEDERE